MLRAQSAKAAEEARKAALAWKPKENLMSKKRFKGGKNGKKKSKNGKKRKKEF